MSDSGHPRSLEEATEWFFQQTEPARQALRAALSAHGIEVDDYEEYEPHPRVTTQVAAELFDLMTPEIDLLLAVYEAGETQVREFDWTVLGEPAHVVMTASPTGVLIDSSLCWFARRLHHYYSKLGYRIEALNHLPDEYLLDTTVVRIVRAGLRLVQE